MKREIDTIKEKYLWYSPLPELNDAMEGLYEAEQKTNKYKTNEKAYDHLKQMKLQKRICSFSESFDNELMWAHYAGQFKGICIEYSVRDVLKLLPDDVSLVRVYYSSKLSYIADEELTSHFSNDKIISNKTKSWEHEKEWRIISATSKLELSSQCVRRVYAGPHIGRKNLEHLQKTLATESIFVWTMIVDGYRIKFEAPPVRWR